MSVPSPAPAELAALLPEFDFLRELGRGGAAIVYLARDRELRREVAVKVVRERFLDDAETSARFEREARTVARLQHPNIVAVYGARRLANGALALVMQHVPGCTLKQLICEQGPLPFVRVERVLGEVAAALVHAHHHDIVHRDIKPENIYLHRESGRALLADFGIAKPLDAESSLTLSGTVIGTPAYMSPEQVDGREVDARSDLYSLGLVGYEMLTGRRPWEGENLYSIIYKQKHEELPPLEQVRPDTPPALRSALDGALKKEREQRWSSVAEFAAQLAPLPDTEAQNDAPAAEAVSSPSAQPPEESEAAHTIRYRKPAPPPLPVAAPPSAAPPETVPEPEVLAAVAEQVETALRARPARRIPPTRRAVSAAMVLVLGAGATLVARPEWEPRPDAEPALAPTADAFVSPARPTPEPTPPAAAPTPKARPAEPVPESKPEPKPELKPAPKPEPKPSRKPTPKPEPRSRSSTRSSASSRREAEPESAAPPHVEEAAVPRLGDPRAEVRRAQWVEPASAPSLERVEMVPRPRNRGAVESALASALSPAERALASGVSLWVLVDAAGRARDARVSGSSGRAAVDAAALRAARRLEFAPASGQAPLVWVGVVLRLPGS